MNRYYDMGEDHLAYAGMDDAGETSSWYVLNAIGIYTYSPADPEYIVTVPLFDKVTFRMGDGRSVIIRKEGKGEKIQQILCGKKPLKGWFINHNDMLKAGEVVIQVQ